MIVVVAGIIVKEGKADDYLQCSQKVVAETRKEEGCISYEPCRSNDDPLKFAMVEKWKSQKDLDAHMKTAHFTEFAAGIDGLLAEPLSVDVYTLL